MVTKREQKDGRVINLPVYVSNHITDEMIRLFLESGKAMSVNAGRISEQVVLPYLETHFGCKGEVVALTVPVPRSGFFAIWFISSLNTAVLSC